RVYLTGGVPPVFWSAEELYEATYPHVRLKNQRLFEHLPHVRTMARAIADHLHTHEESLPNGQRFTPEQFQLLGIGLGRSRAHVPMAFLLEDAFVHPPSGRRLSYAFGDAMLARQSTQTNPIYALLHEAIYCDRGQASRWAAHRVRRRFPEFDDAPGAPFWFTGEMIYPWMFDQLKNLEPLKEAAEMLAVKDDWGPLYDPEQLAKNTVPLACMVYAEDMYVDANFSQQVLAKVPRSRAWISNEYEHNGIGVDGDRILSRLMTMADDIARLP
ncbi:MAG: alpha/beta hydrolase, partial [Myxococcota bacterium]